MLIKRLDRSNSGEWLDFFDNRAFADHLQWAHCYCTCYFKPVLTGYNKAPYTNRDYAIWLIENGIMKGYLAYEDGKAVGWCNANRKDSFPGLARSYDNEEVQSIVCYVVEKKYRGRGISRQLLDRVVKDAEEEGMKIIEAYPNKRARSASGNYHGSYEMYERSGFKEEELKGVRVMRKYL